MFLAFKLGFDVDVWAFWATFAQNLAFFIESSSHTGEYAAWCVNAIHPKVGGM
jgi:hypothetical protein